MTVLLHPIGPPPKETQDVFGLIILFLSHVSTQDQVIDLVFVEPVLEPNCLAVVEYVINPPAVCVEEFDACESVVVEDEGLAEDGYQLFILLLLHRILDGSFQTIKDDI